MCVCVCVCVCVCACVYALWSVRVAHTLPAAAGKQLPSQAEELAGSAGLGNLVVGDDGYAVIGGPTNNNNAVEERKYT